jgi:hypothetical protein
MIKNYVISNGRISRPTYVQGVTPDADLNGISWSNKVGLFYNIDPMIYTPITPPVVVPTQGVIQGKHGVS